MTPNAKPLESLVVDAANGVGASKMVRLHEHLSDLLPLEIFNDGSKGQLNEKVREKTQQNIRSLNENFLE